MNKFNKKGFTLIEMLVVIAIIAVLVSIIIPIVGNSTAKARAATDAANLRSVKAELTIMALNNGLDVAETATAVPAGISAPESKQQDGVTPTYTFDGTNIEVYYGEKTIEVLAEEAEGGAAADVATTPAA